MTSDSLVCAGTLAVALDDVGQVLQVAGHVFGDDRVAGRSPAGNGDDGTVAVAYVARAGGRLLAGGVRLAEDGNQYAASAMLRQLVEVEHMAHDFALYPASGGHWLRSTREQREHRVNGWGAAAIRQRTGDRFVRSHYTTHCELGGHLTPRGARSLLDGHPLVADVVAWEAAHHGHNVWLSVLAATEARHGTDGLSLYVTDARRKAVERAWAAVRPPGA